MSDTMPLSTSKRFLLFTLSLLMTTLMLNTSFVSSYNINIPLKTKTKTKTTIVETTTTTTKDPTVTVISSSNSSSNIKVLSKSISSLILSFMLLDNGTSSSSPLPLSSFSLSSPPEAIAATITTMNKNSFDDYDYDDNGDSTIKKVITKSDLGLSVRRSIVQGAKIADNIDLKWERFSDSLRDEKKCDPITNRRLYDNGKRKDGTNIGNPVLGALCNPEPKMPLDYYYYYESDYDSYDNNNNDNNNIGRSSIAKTILTLSDETASDIFHEKPIILKEKVNKVKKLVEPSFSRAKAKTTTAATTTTTSADADADAVTSSLSEEEKEKVKQQNYNMDIYTRMRTYGDILISNNNNNNNIKSSSSGTTTTTIKESAVSDIPSDTTAAATAATYKSIREDVRKFDNLWGSKMIALLAPNANKNDFTSIFPKPDPTEKQPYNENMLLDALGTISVVLNKMQNSGLIGHWEISIPEDDYGNVVTIAVDDDVSIASQILSKEQGRPLSGSYVVALVRSAMDNIGKINYDIDTFFIDPTTTKQEEYNPTQLLVSLSNLEGV